VRCLSSKCCAHDAWLKYHVAAFLSFRFEFFIMCFFVVLNVFVQLSSSRRAWFNWSLCCKPSFYSLTFQQGKAGRVVQAFYILFSHVLHKSRL
jgi:hypothetical protein